MQYSELKLEIDEEMVKLAKLIEQFCVIENREYIKPYKKSLNELHSLLEEIKNN
jgi:hypothetical protein